MKQTTIIEADERELVAVFWKAYMQGWKDKAEQLEKDNKLYTKKEAAALIGVSERTLHNWMKSEMVEYTKIGGRVLFTREQIQLLTKYNFLQNERNHHNPTRAQKPEGAN